MIPPLTKWINDIKVKLGFSRTMTADGADVVDAVNKQSDQIAYLQNGYYLEYNSLNALKSDLPSKVIAIAQNNCDTRLLKIRTYFTDDVFTYGAIYTGFVNNIIYNSGDDSVYFGGSFISQNGDEVAIGYSNGTWSFENVSKKIANIAGDIVDITSPASVASGVTVNAMKCIHYPHLKIVFLTFNITFTSSLAHNGIVFTLPDTIPLTRMQCGTSISAVNATSIAGRMMINGRNVIAFGNLAPAQNVTGTIVYPTY